MPCDSIQIRSINLKAANKHLMKKALTEDLKWRITGETATSVSGVTRTGVSFTVDFKSGKVNMRAGNEEIADEIKMAYGRTVVMEGIRRYGWATPHKAKGDINRFSITRRY